MLKQLFIAITISSALLSCKQSDESSMNTLDLPVYALNLIINPEDTTIIVEGNINLSKDIISDTVIFYLEKNLEIEYFKTQGNNIVRIDTSPSDNRFMPNARRIYIDYDKIPEGIDELSIDFSYSGKPRQLPDFFANRFGPDWTEIGLYYPWFPYNPDELKLFDFDLKVENPEEYTVFGIGKIEKGADYTTISSDGPATDIVVCLSDDVSVHQSLLKNNNKLKIFHHTFTDSLVRSMTDDVTAIIGIYNKWFGEKTNDISIIETKRSDGGGYARIGGVMLNDIDHKAYFSNREAYSRYFAHELAHLWWFKAKTTTWEDWLNESFAEYSALMVLREFYGQQVYDNWIDRKIATIEDTDVIWGFDRNNSDYDMVVKVIYNKGPVLLSKLETRIGNEQFIKLCKKLVEKDMRKTEAFLSILSEQEGPEVSQWFENLLKTY